MLLKSNLSPKRAGVPDSIRKHKYFPRLLKNIERLGNQKISKRIMQSAWKSPRAAKSIKKDLHSETKKRVVRWWFTKPWALYHEYGVKKQKMKWLVGINKVIPIKTAGGLIFRWAPKTMAKAWIHPGLKAKHFFRNGLQDTQDRISKLVKQTLKRWAKGRK